MLHPNPGHWWEAVRKEASPHGLPTLNFYPSFLSLSLLPSPSLPLPLFPSLPSYLLYFFKFTFLTLGLPLHQLSLAVTGGSAMARSQVDPGSWGEQSISEGKRPKPFAQILKTRFLKTCLNPLNFRTLGPSLVCPALTIARLLCI